MLFVIFVGIEPMQNLAPGVIVDKKYKVEKLLGEGGMGVVWLCRDVMTDMPVVLKAIRAEFTHLKDYRERILAEGRALARIDHPNVVRLNAVIAEEHEVCLVMQFIEGESLDARLERNLQNGTRFSVDEAISIFRQIVSGVAAAHAEGIIHRDLKPANVLIRAKDGTIKVTDFGIAKEEAEAQQGKGSTQGIIGSVRYMAPEQCTGKKDLDKRVDIYALGIVLYELLIGKPPFEADNNFELMSKHVYNSLPSIFEQRRDVSDWLEGVVLRCAAKSREDRFASCEEVLAALSPEPVIVYRSGTIAGGPVPPQMPSRTQIAVGGPPPSAAAVTAAMPIPVGMTPQPPGVFPAMATAPAAAITAPTNTSVAPKRGAAAISLTIAGSVLCGLAISYSLGWFGSPPKESLVTTKATLPPPPMESPKPATAFPATSAKSILEPLEGAWRSATGREYQAVLVGEVLEMRIREVRPFLAQGYEQDEPRLLLKVSAGKKDVFLIEDRLRPNAPVGKEYDPARARATCLVPYSEIEGKPLEARLEDGKLRINMVVIKPDTSHYTFDGKYVTGCRNLSTAEVSPIESVLSRP